MEMRWRFMCWWRRADQLQPLSRNSWAVRARDRGVSHYEEWRVPETAVFFLVSRWARLSWLSSVCDV